MSQKSTHITIPDNLDGLEEAAERLLSGEDKLLEDVKEKFMHARIRHEYRMLKKKRGHGQAAQIRMELAEKYFNNPERTGYIKEILYRKY